MGVHGHGDRPRQGDRFVGGDHVSGLKAIQLVVRAKAQQRLGLRFGCIRVFANETWPATKMLAPAFKADLLISKSW